MVTGPLDRVSATTRSPDGQITATLTARDQATLRFQPGAYRRYRESELSHQLSQLATHTWVDYQRSWFAALSEEIGETVRSAGRSTSPKVNGYRAALAEIRARGRSRDGWIEVESTGLVRWQVRVHEGACAELSEEEFIAEAGTALRDVLDGYGAQQRDIRETFLNRG